MKYDPYINMQITIPKGENELLIEAGFKWRAVNIYGKYIGKANDNPILDSRKYEIEYEDRILEVLAANSITENIFMQVDEEGKRQIMLA